MPRWTEIVLIPVYVTLLTVSVIESRRGFQDVFVRVMTLVWSIWNFASFRVRANVTLWIDSVWGGFFSSSKSSRMCWFRKRWWHWFGHLSFWFYFEWRRTWVLRAGSALGILIRDLGCVRSGIVVTHWSDQLLNLRAISNASESGSWDPNT